MALQPITAGDRTITGADRQRISDLLDRSVADNTRIMYASAWRSFEAWARARGRSHPLPASPELVAAYLAERAVAGKTAATVKLHRAALGAIHRSTGHQDPTDNEGVRQLLAGVARSNGKAQRQAKPRGAEALGAVRATAASPRTGPRGRREKPWTAERRGKVDVALLAILRDGLLRRSEAADLRWGDVGRREDGAALLHVRRSKTDPEAEGAVLYVSQAAARALQAIMPQDETVDPEARVIGLSASQIGRRVKAAARAAGLGDGFTGHSGRVGMAQDLAAAGAELPELMTAGRWKSSAMPARYTARQAAGRGAVARYYQEGG